MSHSYDSNSNGRVPRFSRAVCARKLALSLSKGGEFRQSHSRIPFLAALLLCSTVLPLIAQSQKPAAGGTENLPTGPMQSKATTACIECHEARIILQQRLSKGAWVKEVDKMIKWGAVVDANDHDPLVDYLSANFGVDQPPYEPPRTTSEKSGTRSK
jgi:hypothetical protein